MSVESIVHSDNAGIKTLPFSSIEEFYAALKARGRHEGHIEIIKRVFDEQLLEVDDLSDFTDSFLKEYVWVARRFA